MLTPTVVAPTLVIDSWLYHHMCNDRSMFTRFKKLSLPKPIHLGDNTLVITLNCRFVAIQGYQVLFLHTPTL